MVSDSWQKNMERYNYPFAAAPGQEKLKQALILCAVNPAIGGVLVAGEKGTGKSTLARGLRELLGDSPFVDLPLNITEDRLVGALDTEQTLKQGKPVFQPGLLQKAHGGILYADEVNLLPEQIVNILLQVSASGVNHVEREGISLSHPAKFVLIGTMNPEEGPLRPGFLDRFGLYVEVHGEKRPGVRCEIMAQRLAYEQNPDAFHRQWQEKTDALAQKIQKARHLLSYVNLPDDCARFAAELSQEGCCEGHRPELVLCRTAMALASWEDRNQVTQADIRNAAEFVLPHRIREPLELSQQPMPEHEAPKEADSIPPETLPEDLPGELAPVDSSQTQEMEEQNPNSVEAIEPMEDSVNLQILEQKHMASLGSGKRLKVRSNSDRGRYVRYRLPRGKTSDLAVDATLRAAVLSGRNSPDRPGILVKPEDFRQKIREQRTGAVILFLVDASGSMGARKRMGAVKGAVLSILQDAYQKRDTVGIVAFRGQEARVLLPFTRSVDLAQKQLRVLPTGGKTPLAEGLRTAGNLLRANAVKQKQAAQLLILVSDGRANAGRGEDPFQEALDMAHTLSAEPFASVVLDTEQGYARFGMAKKIAEALGAEYCPLNQISQQEIQAQVGRYLR